MSAADPRINATTPSRAAFVAGLRARPGKYRLTNLTSRGAVIFGMDIDWRYPLSTLVRTSPSGDSPQAER